MGRGPSSFKESDYRRAVRAAQKEGINIGRIEVEGGRVTIVPADLSGEQLGDWNEAVAKLEGK